MPSDTTDSPDPTAAPGGAGLADAAGTAAFAELGLPARLLEAVTALGFTTPTAIQAAAIPPLLAGRDVTGVAQTGTGKTAAFGLPLLAAVDPTRSRVQALVLTPTRELALQVAEAIESFASGLPGLSVLAVYGGAPYLPQQRGLARGAQVVVGTPGRVIDHLERGSLVLDDVRMLVLDEADEMLRMGFAEDVDRIFSAAPARRQVALFSATMPPAIVRVAQQHTRDAVQLAVTPQSSTVAAVRQTYAIVPARHKTGALARVLATTSARAAIVFVRTREAAEEVGSALVARGLRAAWISGDVAQKDRERIVERLRAGTVDVVVATDVAARGLDVERLDLVVNLDVPREAEAYVHRIGRTGRAGRTGEALTFFTPNEQRRLRTIERATRQPLVEVAIPTPAEVSAHRARALLARVEERAQAGRLELYREAVAAFLAENPAVEPLELAAALAALAVGDEGPRAREDEQEDAGTPEFAAGSPEHGGGRGPRADRGQGRRPGGGTRYRVAVGHTSGARPEAIVGAITGEGGLRGADLGKIDIFPTFSLVEISAELDAAALARIGAARVGGKPLRIRVDQGAPQRASRPGAERGGRPTAGHPGADRGPARSAGDRGAGRTGGSRPAARHPR